MNRKIVLFVAILLVATASYAPGGTDRTVTLSTRNVGPYLHTGSGISIDTTGDYHRISIFNYPTAILPPYRTSDRYNELWPYRLWWPLYPGVGDGYTTITDPATGQSFTFVRPWSDTNYRPYYRNGYTYVDRDGRRRLYSTGTNRGFSNEYMATNRRIARSIHFQNGELLGRGDEEEDNPLEAGDLLFAQGRYVEAAQAFAEVVEANPAYGIGQFALAHATFATGEYDRAAAAIGRGVKLLPRWADVPMDRREFYVDPQDFEIQLWALQEHLRQHPDDADARLVLAYNLYFTRRPDAAGAELQKILEAHPDNATAQYFLKHTQP